MQTAVIFDLEYWTNTGVMERNWDGPGEYRELTEIGAIRINTENFELENSFHRFCKPVYTELTHFQLDLTQRKKEDFSNAPSAPVAIRDFFDFVGSDKAFCYGKDGLVILENLALHKVDAMALNAANKNVTTTFLKTAICKEDDRSIEMALYGDQTAKAEALSGGEFFFALQSDREPVCRLRTVDILPWFTKAGINTTKVSSGDLARHLHLDFSGLAHDPVVDSKSVARAAQHLIQLGYENIFAMPRKSIIVPGGPYRPLSSRTTHPMAIADVLAYRADR